jgi:hypothetical protein
LFWENVPENTKELVIVMEDPDAPLPNPVVHLIVAGIPPSRNFMAEGEMNLPSSEFLFGRNTLRKFGYAGPRPIPGHGLHRYAFQIYAAKEGLSFSGVITRAILLEAMGGKVIARGRLDGTYTRG